MAVDAEHAGRDLLHGASTGGEFEDPTEDLSEDAFAPAQTLSPASTGVADPFEPGRVLCGRYELDRVIGRGGFCVVLSAIDLRRRAAGDEDARVAIKALRPERRQDPQAQRRLTAEFRQLQQLSHPNIVRVYDLDRHEGHWFLVLELLEGVSLAGLLKHCEGGRVPARRALEIVHACADALGWAHGRRKVHGDIKPGNVFVLRDEGVRLLDFGTATGGETQGTGQPPSGTALATPAYASPQVLEGREPGARDDLYSLACVAFELLSGVHPFGRVDAREARAQGRVPAEMPALQPGHRRALAAALSFEPAQRPATVADFVALLEAPEPATAGPVTAMRAGTGTARAVSGRTGWIVAGAVLLVAVGGWFFRPGGRPAEPAVREAPSAGLTAATTRAAQEESIPATPIAEGPVAAAQDPSPPVSVTSQQPGLLANAGPARPVPSALRQPVQQVDFAEGTVLVSRSAPAAAIPLRRSGALAGRAEVSWRIEEGSARAGRDFAGPLSGTLVMADGQAAATVFVPLVAGVAATEDRRFGVILAGVRGAAGAGSRAQVEVTLRSFVEDRPRVLPSRD